MNRILLALSLLVAALVVGAVYDSERRHDAAAARAAEVERQIADARRATHVLQVEWSYLTRPERLEQLAIDYLDLQPTGGRQVVSGVDRLDQAMHDSAGIVTASATEVRR